MSQGISTTSDRFADRVKALRLQVQFAVLIGGMNGAVQECLQELRLLTQQPATLNPATLNK